MKLIEYLSKVKRYEVFGCYTTPTSDYLFNNYNHYLKEWIEIYGNCEVLEVNGIEIRINNKEV